MSGTDNAQQLEELLQQAVDEASWAGFKQRVSRCEPAWEEGAFLDVFASVGRLLGRNSAVSDAGAEPPVLEGPAGPVSLAGATTDLLGRMWLLLRLAEAKQDEAKQGLPRPGHLDALVAAAYEEGDRLEKIAVVRTLGLLPEPARFVGIALDVGRCNDLDLFSALSAHNPLPAFAYDELAWNQLYMKTAFLGLPLSAMVGVARRHNRELARMALEYVEQQESALRTFPPELWLAIAHAPPRGAVGKTLGYLSHAVVEQRHGAALALAQISQPRTATFIDERLAVEPDPEIRHILTRTLAGLGSGPEVD